MVEQREGEGQGERILLKDLHESFLVLFSRILREFSFLPSKRSEGVIFIINVGFFFLVRLGTIQRIPCK